MSNKKTKTIKKKRKLTKKQLEKKLDEELRIAVHDVATFLPYSTYYQIVKSKKKRNEDKGWIAVSYLPNDREIRFHIYKDFYDDFSYPLSVGARRYLYRVVCHEVGHCVIEQMHNLVMKRFISEHELKNTCEKLASDVGDIILKGLDNKKLKK